MMNVKNFDNYEILREDLKIILWTKIFNQSYGKTYENEGNLTDEDYFWIILSSVNFMDAFGANSSDTDKVYRERILNGIKEYLGVENDNSDDFNKEVYEKEGFFQALFNDNMSDITIGKYTYSLKKTKDNIREITIKNNEKNGDETTFEVSFLTGRGNPIENLFEDECENNFKDALKKINRDKGYGGLQIQFGEKKPILFLEEADKGGKNKKRQNIQLKAEVSLSKEIEEKAREIEKNGINGKQFKFTTANNEEVKNFLSWYYRNKKKGIDKSNFSQIKKEAFRKLEKEIGDVENKYYKVFCNAIQKSIKYIESNIENNKGLNLKLGHQKTFQIKKEEIDKALTFFSKYRKKDFKILLINSESIHFLGNLYSYNAQLGTIGELLAIKNFSKWSKATKSQGQTNDIGKVDGTEVNLGESFQDVLVQKGELNFGINVKHFLSNQSTIINLYSDTKKNTYNLNSQALYKYMSIKDWREVNYLNINTPYFKKSANIEQELEYIFNNYLPEFLRMIGSPILENESKNLFYQLNNLIVPASILLGKIEEKIKESNNSFFSFQNINKKPYTYKEIGTENGNLLTQCVKQNISTKVVFTGLKYVIPRGV